MKSAGSTQGLISYLGGIGKMAGGCTQMGKNVYIRWVVDK